MANKLINEQSLYLQQHARNPVDWYPWGEEAFEDARKQNKPVIVSIGYAACHWCHVMERESFEDEGTAKYMNDHFINIKVDREEHPDVDQMYMDAVQAIGGSGGWPLNVFATPDKIPFYGGTYYPPRPAYNRPSWMQLMERMNEIWKEKPEEIQAQSSQMKTFLENASKISFKPSNANFDIDSCDVMAESLLKLADTKDGGFGKAPKFPQTMAIQYLLEHYHYTNNDESLKCATLSLDKMMDGGIYDQIGGGFARYSTDAQWLAPHFEKMLYDNALLINVYCTAYTKNRKYEKIIRETIAFVERELKDNSGIYYSALDADSEGEEGKFYTFTWNEWNTILGDSKEVVTDYFGVKKEGNWEGTNILHVAKTIDDIATEKQLNIETVEQEISNAKQKLLTAREKRIRPQTDDKCLLSWNALMSIALVNAATTLNDKTYLKLAEQQIQKLLENFEKEGKLFHVWKNGKARINVTLEDYATLIQALLQIASATSEEKYLLRANEFCEKVIEEFQQKSGVLFYYTSIHSQNVPIRKVDLYDGAVPSANAIMAHNLSLLGMIMSKSEWAEQSYQMLQQLYTATTKHTLSFAYWAVLSQRSVYGLKTMITVGKHSNEIHNELQQKLLPHCYKFFLKEKEYNIPILIDKNHSDETHIFVCLQDACLSPVTNVVDVLKLV